MEVKKSVQRIEAMALSVVMAFSLAPMSISAESVQPQPPLGISQEEEFIGNDNGFIKYYVNTSNGGFYIMPSSEEFDETKNPSFADIVIDGVQHTFGKEQAPALSFVNESGTAQTVWHTGGYTVTQILNIVKDEAGTDSYGVFVGYEVSVPEGTEGTVSGRIVLDTMFGPGDNKPVVLSGVTQYITNEVNISEAPAYFRVDDVHGEGAHMAYGLMQDSRLTSPAALSIGHFGNLYDSDYDYVPDTLTDFTSDTNTFGESDSGIVYYYGDMVCNNDTPAMLSTIYGFKNLSEKQAAGANIDFSGSATSILGLSGPAISAATAAVSTIQAEFYKDGVKIANPGAGGYKLKIDGQETAVLSHSDTGQSTLDIVVPASDSYHVSKIEYESNTGTGSYFKIVSNGASVQGNVLDYYARMRETDPDTSAPIPAEAITLKIYITETHPCDTSEMDGSRFGVPDFSFQTVPQDADFNDSAKTLTHLYDYGSSVQSIPAGAHVRMSVSDNVPMMVQGSVTPQIIGLNSSSVVNASIQTDGQAGASSHEITFIMPDEAVKILLVAQDSTTKSQLAADNYREGRKNPLIRDIEFTYQFNGAPKTLHFYTDPIDFGTAVTGQILVATPHDNDNIVVSAKMTGRTTGVITPVQLTKGTPNPGTVVINNESYRVIPYTFSFNIPFGIQDFDVLTVGAANDNNHVFVRSGMDDKIVDFNFPTSQRTFNINNDTAVFQLNLKSPIYKQPENVTLVYNGNGVQDGYTEILTPTAGDSRVYRIRPVGTTGETVFKYGGTLTINADFEKYPKDKITIAGGDLNWRMLSAVENDGGLHAYRLTPVGLQLTTKTPYTGYRIVSVKDAGGTDIPYTATQMNDLNVYDGNWSQTLNFTMPDLKDVTITAAPYELYRQMKVTHVSANDYMQAKATHIIVRGELLKQLEGGDGLNLLTNNDALKAATQKVYFGTSKDKTANTQVTNFTYNAISSEMSFPIPAGVVTPANDIYYADIGPYQYTVNLVTNPVMRQVPFGIMGIAADSANNHYVELADSEAELYQKITGKTLELKVKGEIQYDSEAKQYRIKKGNILFNGVITMTTTGDNHAGVSVNNGTVTLSATNPVDLSVPGLTFAKGVQPVLRFEKGTRYSQTYVENPTGTLQNIAFGWGASVNQMGEIYTSFGIGAKLEDVKLLANSVVFGGEASLGSKDLINFGDIHIERLQFGPRGGDAYTFEGLKGSGSVGMDGMLTNVIDFGPKVSADVDTFNSYYAFAASFGFQLIEFEGEIVLKPVKNIVVPDYISADIQVQPGVPIIPIVPVGYLTGGGASIEGITDTLNGNFSILPPIKLKARAYLDLLKVFKFDPIELTLGPTEVSLGGVPKVGYDPLYIKPFSKFGMGYYYTEYPDRHQVTIKAEMELCLVESFQVFIGGGVIDLSGAFYKNTNQFKVSFIGELYCTVQIPKLFDWGPGGCWSVGPETLFKCAVGVTEKKVYYETKLAWVDVSLAYYWGDTKPVVSFSRLPGNSAASNAYIVNETLYDESGERKGEVALFENFKPLASSQGTQSASRSALSLGASGSSAASARSAVAAVSDVSGGAKTKYMLTIPMGYENPTVFVSAPRTNMKVTDGSGNIVPLVYSKPEDAIGRAHTEEELSNPNVNAIDYTNVKNDGTIINTVLLHLVPSASNITWYIESNTEFECDIVDILPSPTVKDVALNGDTVTWNMEDLNKMNPTETYTAEIYLSKDDTNMEGKDLGHHVASVPVTNINADGNASGTYTINPADIPDYASSGTYYAWVYLIGSKTIARSAEPEATNYGSDSSTDSKQIINANQPAAVTGFSVGYAGNGNALASWDKQSGENIGYRIQPFETVNGTDVPVYTPGDWTPLTYEIPYELAKDLTELKLVLPGLTAGKAYQFVISAYYAPKTAEGEQTSSPVFGPEQAVNYTIPVPNQPGLQVSFSSGTVIPPVANASATLITNGSFDINMQSDQACEFKVYVNDELKSTVSKNAGEPAVYSYAGTDPGSVTISATNTAGDYVSETYIIQIDTAAPLLLVETDKNGNILVAEDGTFTVSVHTEAGAQVVVNGALTESLIADVSGKISFTGTNMDLSAGGNTEQKFVSVSARDAAGNTATEVFNLMAIGSILDKITTISIVPSGTIMMNTGDSVTVYATAIVDGVEYKLAGNLLAYIVEGNSATLDAQTGKLTATSPGTARVTVQFNNIRSETLIIQVEGNGLYAVSYKDGGATGGTVPPSANYSAGDYVTVPGNTGTLAKTGYLFDGWKSDADNRTYKPGENFTMPSKNVEMTAVWVSRYNDGGSGGNSGSDGGSSRQDTYTAALPAPYIIDKAEMQRLIATAKINGWDFVRFSSSLSTTVKAEAWKLPGGKFIARTVADGAVQVQLTFPEPSKSTTDMKVSGYVKGSAVDSIRKLFEKWFRNKVHVVHLEHTGEWGQSIEIAAKVDLTGMDTKNLYFYSYDKASNTYKRIVKPAYWIDKNGYPILPMYNTEKPHNNEELTYKNNRLDYYIDANGYLHFTTELAGDIIISDGPLVKK